MKILFTLPFLLNIIVLHSQSMVHNQLNQLDFMIGDWVGTSTSYDSSGNQNYSIYAVENIQYKLDNCLITLDLQSDSLQLHTVISYNLSDSNYYYQPYYKGGSGKYIGEFVNGDFVVYFNDKKRLFFTQPSEGKFMEYGEKLVNGKWIVYFRDEFVLNN